MINNKKDAKYYCEEGVKRYKKGSKSALKYLQKALELALNDPATPNELLNDIYSDLFCYYDKLSPDYSKALIYFDKLIDTNIDDVELEKAKDFRTEIKANPDKFDETTLLKRANQIRLMNEVNANDILLYIKCLILFNNPKCDEIFYIVAQHYESYINTAAERNIKQAIAMNPKKQEYYDLYFDIIEEIISDCEDDKERHKTIKKYDSTMREILNKSIFIKPTALNYLNLATYYRLILPTQKFYALKISKEAIKALDKSIELDDRNSYIFDRRAYMKSEIKDYDGAIQDYKKSLELFPFEEHNYECIADIYVKKGEKEKAYQYLDDVIAKFVDNIDFQLKLYDLKINIEYNNKDSEKVLADCQKLIDNKEIADIDKHFAYVFKAYELWNAEKYEEAIEIFDFCISINPNKSQNYYDKANCLCHIRKYEEAKEVFEMAVNLYRTEYNVEPNNYNFEKGFCYELAKQDALALKFYNKAIKNGESRWRPYRNKIGILVNSGKPYLALKWCERAEKLYKKELDKGFYGNKGIALFFLGEYKNAIKNLKKFPEYSVLKVLIAYCKYLQGQEKALKELENIYNKEKLDVALCCLATIYTTKKEFEKALESCDKIQEQNADTDVIRAFIYKKMGDDLNSEKYLNLAVEKDEKKRTKEKLIKGFEYSSQVKFD